MKFCRFCATQNTEQATHCATCGASLAAPAAPPSVAPPQAVPLPQPTPLSQPFQRPASTYYAPPPAPATLPPLPYAPPINTSQPYQNQTSSYQAPALSGEWPTLAQLLRERKKLPPRDAAIYLSDVASALQAYHQSGRAHGDLRLDSIRISPQGVQLSSGTGAALTPAARAADYRAILALLTPLCNAQGWQLSTLDRDFSPALAAFTRAMLTSPLEIAQHANALRHAAHTAQDDAFTSPHGAVAKPLASVLASSLPNNPHAAPAAPEKAPAPQTEIAPKPVVKRAISQRASRLDVEKTKLSAVRRLNRGAACVRVQWTLDERELWCGGENGLLSIWSATTGGQGVRMETHFKGAEVTSLTFDPEAGVAVGGYEDGRVRFWEPRANRMRHVIDAHEGRVSSLDFGLTRGGRPIVASGGSDGQLRAWDVAKGTRSGYLEAEMVNIRAVALASDGVHAALGGDSGALELWNWPAALPIWSAHEHNFWLTALRFSPDNRILASGAYDRTIRLWSVGDGRCGREINCHDAFITGLDFSPCGTRLLSSGADGAVWLHDWRAHKSRRLLVEDGASDIAWSGDGSHFAVAGADGLSLWRLD